MAWTPSLHLAFKARQWWYDLRTGLLFLPLVCIVAALGTTAVLLPLEATHGAQGLPLPWLPRSLVWDPASAQSLLAVLAGAMVSVLALVYSILLIALTLVSLQFSPRILVTFVRDRTSQWTLAAFLGTFTWCVVTLRAVQGGATPFVPSLTLNLAIFLALSSLLALVYFIHHIAQAIQAGNLVRAAAQATQQMLDDEAAMVVGHGLHVWRGRPVPRLPLPGRVLAAPVAGYVQLVDLEQMRTLALEQGLTVHVLRTEGDHVVRGQPLVEAWPAERVDATVLRGLGDAFDLGPGRTVQSDVRFGFRQIVDIALKAISPAVNDPTTAEACLDGLEELLCHAAATILAQPAEQLATAQGVHASRPGLVDLIDLSFRQIRHYGAGDFAVVVRLVETLEHLAVLLENTSQREHLQRHARHLAEALAGRAQPLADDERSDLLARLVRLQGASELSAVARG